MNKNERKKLTEIIEANGGENWWVPDKFEKYTRSKLPVQLKIIVPPPIFAENFNCFAFAFGLEKDKRFLGGLNPVQQEFIKYLLDKNYLARIAQPKTGDLVFYKDHHGIITHAGIMQSSNIVISKWMWGCLIEHDLWDVPSSFGDEIFFVKPVESKIFINIYQEYKDSGAEIKPID